MIKPDLIQQIWETVRNRFTYKQIEQLLRDDPNELIALLDKYVTEELQSTLVPQIESIVIESGAPSVITEMLPKGAISSPYLFSISQPYTAVYINDFVGNDIREITETTVNAIRQTISREEQAGVNPRTTARHFRENIGLTMRQEQAVSNYRTALENLDRNALDRVLRDKRFDSTVLNAISNDKPMSRDKIEMLVQRYRERSIKSRSETIARTEQLASVAVGQRQSMLQALNAGKLSPRLRRFWEYTHDSRTRHWHKDVPRLNPEGVTIDEKYLTQPPGRIEYVNMPKDPESSASNRVNCRCRERYELV